MKQTLKKGDTVRHKASFQTLVVAYADDDLIKCRYLNEATGIYETQEFRDFELLPLTETVYKSTEAGASSEANQTKEGKE